MPATSSPPPRLLDQVRDALRGGHYSRRTEEAYLGWIRRFVLFHDKTHPAQMAEPEVTAFLTHLAVRDEVSASTQNQALGALLFLYRYVIRRELRDLGGMTRARTPERLPVVLDRAEVRAVLDQMTGVFRLVGLLLYGGGLRLTECLELRVKDLDVQRRQIVVRRGKGNKDRVVKLPDAARPVLADHLRDVNGPMSAA